MCIEFSLELGSLSWLFGLLLNSNIIILDSHIVWENIHSDMYAQRRIKSASAFAQCDQNLFGRIVDSLGCKVSIRKTYLYSFDPLKPHFYIVKLGFTGGIYYFSYFCSKHRLWVLVRIASTRRLQWVPTFYVLSRYTKNIRIFIWKTFSFCWWNFRYIWIGMFS